MERAELLAKHGFLSDDGKKKYEKEGETYKLKAGQKFSKSDADIEYRETTIFGDYQPTYFPKPLKWYNLWYQVHDLSLEGPYFWVIDNMREHIPIVEKLEDSFAAAENSAFFGITQTRLGAQQDKVSMFLATVGKMIKELFQMVREIRILKERLNYYVGVEEEVKKDIKSRKKGFEITLKGMFVDLVQGGGKSAASVYGMARELEFMTLPDLFFDAPPFKDQTELETWVNGLKENFNENVIRVLIRHLTNYMTWRTSTHLEHKNRHRFMLHYLRQHYDIIRLYIDWLKPYLRHVEKLTLKRNDSSPDMISSFEGSMLDIEVLARYPEKVGGTKQEVHKCLLVTFNYRTRPEMKVVQEGYNRGPVHVGKMEMNFRVYVWTDAELKSYKNLKNDEAKELMGMVSSSVKKAMEGLGKELEAYLKEADQLIEHDKEEKEETPEEKSFMEKILGDFYSPKKPAPAKQEAKVSKAEEVLVQEKKKELSKKSDPIRKAAWNTYKNFKKAHRLVQW